VAKIYPRDNKPTIVRFQGGLNKRELLHSGPILSRFDRFLLIWPRAAPSNQRKLHFLSNLHVYSGSAVPIVFQDVLRDQNGSPIFSNGVSK